MNNNIMFISAISLVVGVAFGVFYSGKLGIYSSSEECILANMDKAHSARAAIIISHSCKNMYPEHGK
jgi:hypothetical protein